jgi:hypothetical protein
MLVAVSVVVMMSMMMTVAFAGVSAGFRLERQLAKGHRQAELAQHIVQHVIVMVAQLARHNLQRYVTVAEVIAGLRQHKRIVAAHHRHPFISGNHLHKLGAVFVAEHIAAAQQQAAGQQQTGFPAIVEGDFYPAFDANINRQRNAGGRGGGVSRR